jgi:hypothetical protein
MSNALEHHLDKQVETARDFFWHRVRWRAVKEQLPAGPFTLLDVGAGVGLIGEYLAEEVPQARYVFTEPIGDLQTRLEERWGAEANFWEREREAGADVVTLLDVLEHIEDDHGFMAKLAGDMKPGARLVMTVPALQGLWSYWDEALGHFRRYDRPMVRRVIAPLPLEIVELSYLFPEMLPPALLRHHRNRPAEAGAAEFPELPPLANKVLEQVGTASLRLRRHWQRGTSLLLVARRV